MGNTALVQARIDPQLKADVDSIFSENGLDTPTAVRMFLTKVRQVGGLPFEVRTYTPETVEAMEEANRISRDASAATFGSFAEVLAAIEQDDDE